MDVDLCSIKDVSPSRAQVPEFSVIGTCNSLDHTPIMWALMCGQVEMFKLLISKDGSISDGVHLSTALLVAGQQPESAL